MIYLSNFLIRDCKVDGLLIVFHKPIIYRVNKYMSRLGMKVDCNRRKIAINGLSFLGYIRDYSNPLWHRYGTRKWKRLLFGFYERTKLEGGIRKLHCGGKIQSRDRDFPLVVKNYQGYIRYQIIQRYSSELDLLYRDHIPNWIMEYKQPYFARCVDKRDDVIHLRVLALSVVIFLPSTPSYPEPDIFNNKPYA